ncbi:MAG: hypothetical protein KKE83_03830 [Proteobacteria bacterium]|nr:hypothetical protein [Pseudomonadota bacterium]MBU1545249.1 hypothetical protein [Pseudomonadota bacterium]MBU2618795.1 hypothetical protein [Pseudomonadota bacterium]
MHRTAVITMGRRNGNLHITIVDSFTMGAAARLVASMDSCDNRQGNIFIHTEKISDIAPNSRTAFAELLHAAGLPQDRKYFTGIQGKDIAPEGCRVIVNEHRHGGHGGCGRCRNCKCREKQAA